MGSILEIAGLPLSDFPKKRESKGSAVRAKDSARESVTMKNRTTRRGKSPADGWRFQARVNKSHERLF